MKFLKLIPAAAIALTAFTTYEAKAFKSCLYNNAGFETKLRVANSYQDDPSVYKTTDSFSAGVTKCIKMGDIPIPQGSNYFVEYLMMPANDLFTICNYKSGGGSIYSSSDVGETKTYTVSGTTSNPSCKL